MKGILLRFVVLSWCIIEGIVVVARRCTLNVLSSLITIASNSNKRMETSYIIPNHVQFNSTKLGFCFVGRRNYNNRGILVQLYIGFLLVRGSNPFGFSGIEKLQTRCINTSQKMINYFEENRKICNVSQKTGRSKPHDVTRRSIVFSLTSLFSSSKTLKIGDNNNVVLLEDIKKEPGSIALVGDTFCGKSALFNRLTRNEIPSNLQAIVGKIPNTTRDRHYGYCSWGEFKFKVIDTGGIILDEQTVYAEEVKFQTMRAIDEADVLILVVDGKKGISMVDESIAHILRREGKPTIVCVNKCDCEFNLRHNVHEFWKLGLGTPFPCSAIHGTGINTLLDQCAEYLSPPPYAEEENSEGEYVNVCLVGRPNVGKSTLFNTLVRSERAIVSDVPGTTRDSIDHVVVHKHGTIGTHYRFIDTAGLIKKTSKLRCTEQTSVEMTLKALSRCDVALLILDGHSGIRKQDILIAKRIIEEEKTAVILVNKWDIANQNKDLQRDKAMRYVLEVLYPLRWAQVLFVSGLTRKNVHNIWGAVKEAAAQYRRRIPSSALTTVLRDFLAINPPPFIQGKRKRGKIYLIFQVNSSPPTFVLFCNRKDLISSSFIHRIEFTIRQAFQCFFTPMKWILRGKHAKQFLLFSSRKYKQ